MKFGNFRLGLRTIKTSFSVFLCILFFHLTNRGTPMIACLAAVFAMRQDISSTISFGKSRIIGNGLGGAVGLFYFIIQKSIGHNFYVELFLVPLLVIIVIVLSDGMNNNTGIVGATSTLLVIVLTIPESQTFTYALGRVVDTFIGTVIAIAVNSLFKPQVES